MIFEWKCAVKYNCPCTNCNAAEDAENVSDYSIADALNENNLNVYQRIVFTKLETV